MKSISLENMTDVCVGPLTLKGINREITRYMLSARKPTRLVVDIRRTSDGYYTRIYMPKKDFRRTG